MDCENKLVIYCEDDKYFHCDLCDKSIKTRSKKKHIYSQHHKSLYESIICKYTVQNPNIHHIEDILKTFFDDYNKKVEFYLIFCKWKLHLSDITINIKSDRLYNIIHVYKNLNLRTKLISKIEHFESNGHKFSHISEMNIVFISELWDMTYAHYIMTLKSMLEWTIIKKLANNPNLIKAFDINLIHPKIRKFCLVIY